MTHRRNLARLKDYERQQLANLISEFLTQERISFHPRVDHMNRFFTHHRAYIFGLEMFIKKRVTHNPNLLAKIVPLPFWDTRGRIPLEFRFFEGRTAVAPNAPTPLPILPPVPRVRSRNPFAYPSDLDEWRNLCIKIILADTPVTDTNYLNTDYPGLGYFQDNNLDNWAAYATPMELANGLGMDITQGIKTTATHYHGLTHSWLGGVLSPLDPTNFIDLINYCLGVADPPDFVLGPFLNMRNTAAPFIFWPLHAFFENLYHTWEEGNLSKIKSCAFAHTSENMMQLFIADKNGFLRHTVNRGEDINLDNINIWDHPNNGGPNTDNPSFGNWDHWDQCGNDREIELNKIVVGNNANGIPEVFGIGNTGEIYHKSINTLPIDAPNDEICSAYSLMPGAYCDISICSNDDGRLETFAIGKDDSSISGKIHHIWQLAPNSSSWSDWELGLFDGGQVQLLSIADNVIGQGSRIHVFSLSENGMVWHRWQIVPNGTWARFNEFLLNGHDTPTTPVPVMKKIAVARNKDNRIEVFGISWSDGIIYHAWQTEAGANNGFTKWHVLVSEKDNTEFAVGKNKDGRLVIFYGKNGRVFHKWQVAANHEWINDDIEIPVDNRANGITNFFTGNDHEGRLVIFGTAGVDNLIWHAWQETPNDGPWLGWLVI